MSEGKTLDAIVAKQMGESGFAVQGNVAGESVMIAAGTNETHGNKAFVVVNGEELAKEQAAQFLNGISCIDTTREDFRGKTKAAEQAFIRAKAAVNTK